MKTLVRWVEAVPRNWRIGAMVYAGLVLFSVAYISLFNWWRIEVPESLRLLRFVMAAAGYGALFWAMAGALAYWIGWRLDQFGRRAFLWTAGALTVFLILFWPGLYDADSFSAASTAYRVPVDMWLAPTPVGIGAVIQHIPWLGAVTWVQVLFFSAAAAYGMQTLREMYAGRVGFIAMAVLMAVSAPLIYNLMLVSRETWLSIASLFLAVECMRFFRDPTWRDGRALGRMLLICMIAFFLRTEALLGLGAVIVVVIGREWMSRRAGMGKTELRKAGLRILSPTLAFLALTYVATPILLHGYERKAAYDITLWIEPVGDILSRTEAGVSQEDLDTIYAVVPRAIFQDNWASKGITAKFWTPMAKGEIKPPADADIGRVRIAVLHVIMAHPGEFLDVKIKQFNAANAARGDGEVAVQPTQTFIDSPRAQESAAGLNGKPHYGGLFPDARRAIENYFVAQHASVAGEWQWAFYPDLLMLLAMLLLLPTAPGYAFASLVLLARVPALFLLMPAEQSKYFAPYDYCLPFLLAGLLAMAMKQVAARRMAGRPTAPAE